MGKRNAYAYASWRRKAGAHTEAKRPDVFDNINGYSEDDMSELKDRVLATQSCQARQTDFDVGDRVLCVSDSPYCGCEGLVVKRDENIDGDPVWTVDFEGAGLNCHLSHELERVY